MSPREQRALASAVREIRARQGLRQEDVASAGGLGRKYIGQVENGDLRPSFAAVLAIARGLGVPLSELVAVYERNVGETGG